MIIINNARQSLWYKRYSEEVERMTKYYIHKNAQAETITRKATPEEIKMYEEQLNKTDCHRLNIVQK